MSYRAVIVLLSAVGAVAAGCSSQSPSLGLLGVCLPEETEPCACADGGMGTSTCGVMGQWGDCTTCKPGSGDASFDGHASSSSGSHPSSVASGSSSDGGSSSGSGSASDGGATSVSSSSAASGDAGSGSDGSSSSTSGGSSTGCGTSCGGTETCCNGVCVNTDNDADNCSACGTACTATAPSTVVCALGRCLTTLASDEDFSGFVDTVTTDSTRVYWMAAPSQTLSVIRAVANSGGAATTVSTAGEPPSGIQIESLALYASTLYYSYAVFNPAPEGTFAQGGLIASPLADVAGSTWELATPEPASNLVANASGVYFYGAQGQMFDPEGTPGGGLWSMTPDSSLQVIVPTATVYALAVSPTDIFWTDAIDTVWSSPLVYTGMGSPTAVWTSDGTEPSSIATDAENVYWVTQASGAACGGCSPALIAAPLAGGTASTLLANLVVPRQIVTDGSFVYVTDIGAPGGGAILRVPVGGGAAVTLAAGTSGAHSIAIDATSLYWADEDSRAVLKVSPR